MFQRINQKLFENIKEAETPAEVTRLQEEPIFTGSLESSLCSWLLPQSPSHSVIMASNHSILWPG
jgi:hypothetical protein